MDVPDTKELKAKYAEIAALKKSIDEKQIRKHNANLRPKHRHRNLTLVLNDPSKYITSITKNGMTLVNQSVFEHTKARELRRAERIARIKRKLLLDRKDAMLKVLTTQRRAKFDGCDRVTVNGTIYAVSRNGNRLVPLTLPFSETDAVWNGGKYSPSDLGVLKAMNPRPGPPEHCRYYGRTGKFLYLFRPY